MWRCICIVFVIFEINAENITDYWSRISEKSTIECVQDDFTKWRDIFPEKKFDRLIETEKCEKSPYIFSFDGKIENHKFEGSGKFKNGSCEKIHKEICLISSLKDIEEIDGNWKNGTLDGIATIRRENGTITIGNFKNGTFYGMKRDWSNGLLQKIAFYDQEVMGPSWIKLNNFLIFEAQNGFINNRKIQELDFVFDLETNEAFIGNFLKHFHILDNIYKVEIEENNENRCLMRPKWKIIEKVDFIILLDRNIKHNYQCQSQGDPEKIFYKWYNSFFLDKNDLGTHNLWKFKSPQNSDFDPNLDLIYFIQETSTYDPSTKLVEMTFHNGKKAKFLLVIGSIDENLKLNGICKLGTSEKQVALIDNYPFFDWRPMQIEANFINGIPQGKAIIGMTMNVLVYVHFINGIIHGPVFGFGVRPHYIQDFVKRGFESSNLEESYDGIHYIGYFKNGHPTGKFWMGLLGEGHLHGEISSDFSVSGQNIAYIYPDGKTALKGKFENKFMIEAFHHEVEEYDCDENGLLFVKKFGPKLSEEKFFYDPPTNESFGGGNSIPDPYEIKLVKLEKSSILNSGDGVIAIKDLPKGKIVAHYSAFLYNIEQYKIYNLKCQYNQSLTDDQRRACFKYTVGIKPLKAYASIPPEADIEPLTLLGGKINHHFTKENAGLVDIEHPRWGICKGIRSMKPIKAGEELFLNYNYKNMEKWPVQLPWYLEAKKAAGLK